MESKWVLENEHPEEEVKSLSSALNIPYTLSKILYSRRITDYEKAKKFFRPTLKKLYDPFLMKGMEVAVKRLRQAVLSDEKIMIYGDYDVDGITSTAFLYMVLKEIGATVYYYIPDRISEGYGLSEQGIQYAAEKGVDLIITVDCGITGHAEIEKARIQGIETLVTDHHEPGQTLPGAVAVIDPKQTDCDYPFKELAGVGVAFKLAQGLLIRLEIDLSVLEHYLEFVAIGTSADIVPLVDENRIFVKKGLEKLNHTENLGLKALLQVTGLENKEIGTGHIVFLIAPRINAVGRMGDAERAVKLLTVNDFTTACNIAQVLEQENRHRKNVDEETFNEALAYAEEFFSSQAPNSLVLSKDGWHPGVIGIVASRVVEKFYRPTILISVEKGIGKGSARSIKDFDIYDAIKQCEDLLIGYGGHKYAAGLSIEENKIPELRERFESLAQETISPDLLIPKLFIDSEITLDEIDERFIKILKFFAPFGPKNMRPVFYSHNLEVVGTPSIVGSNHIKFKVRQNRCVFDVIGFGKADYYYRLNPGQKNLDMVYVIDENEYLGRKFLQLRVKDIK
jgi:single-stranded-DNA-specific exonuclease